MEYHGVIKQPKESEVPAATPALPVTEVLSDPIPVARVARIFNFQKNSQN